MVRKKARNYQIGRTNRTRDRKRKAKPPGKRKTKRGKTYYERRRNRSDRSKWL